jgi:hypothetical protein
VWASLRVWDVASVELCVLGHLLLMDAYAVGATKTTLCELQEQAQRIEHLPSTISCENCILPLKRSKAGWRKLQQRFRTSPPLNRDRVERSRSGTSRIADLPERYLWKRKQER